MYKEELINGKIYKVPHPTPKDQDLVGELLIRLKKMFKDTSFLVAFSTCIKIKEDSFVPDLAVLNSSNVVRTTEAYIGTPTLIIELVRAEDINHVLVTKLNKYANYGVQEYWIINTLNNNCTIYNLSEVGKYIVTCNSDGAVSSKIFRDLKFNNIMDIIS